MASFSERSDRHVVPLWKRSRYAAQSIELQPLKQRPAYRATEFVDEVRSQLEEFRAQPSLGTAADLLNTSLLSRTPELSKSAAQYITNHADKAPESLLNIARASLSEDEAFDDSPSEGIATLRRLLQIEPRNPILQVDLAREYAAVGKLRAAERAMSIAIACSSGNHWVHRMAARFMVHLGKRDEAHALIVRHPDAKDDPWLLAAELALAQAAECAPRFWSKAKSILQGPFPAGHLSELACAIGTLELDGGNSKKAKRIFKSALIAPTENALAQVKWAERSLRMSLTGDLNVAQMTRAFEARFWSEYYRGNLHEAMNHAREWWREEPYSTRPATMLSYVASLLDNTLVIQEAARKGLRANPDDRTLQLNLMFAELSALLDEQELLDETIIRDRIMPIHKKLRHLTRDKNFASHAFANLGLIHYRFGQIEAGAYAYERATELAAAGQDSIREATSRIFHAREAFLAGASTFPLLLEEVRISLRRVKSPGLKFYEGKLELLARFPEKRREILSPSYKPEIVLPDTLDVKKPIFSLEDGDAKIILPPGYIPR